MQSRTCLHFNTLTGTAILGCSLHHAETITITGHSYRLRNRGREDHKQ